MDDPRQTLGKDGPGWPVEALGKTWTFLPLSQGDKAEFGAWVESQVLESAFRLKAGLPPGDFRELLASVNERIARKHYRWGGDGCQSWLDTDDGLAQLGLVLLRERHPGIDRAAVEAVMAANPEAFGHALGEATRAPKSPAPPQPAGAKTA